ncbi:ribonuclease H-like domain-containing protein [Bacillus sp. FJAT-27251]|uniref:ribonuclease H-like domain-containing protein n=1 Tax=Bacillus sp. FJAT-27251 TaxID=1684142 RepID=UPI0006A7BB46|nr:ribonuclease H-like domain-containing protein [Bacillus sp. FJAT-27251]
MSLRNKLNRLKPHLSPSTGMKSSPDHAIKPVLKEDHKIPFMDVWEKENVAPYYFDDQYCLVRKVVYPLSHKHGKYTFTEALEAIVGWNDSKVQHHLSAAGHSPEDLFFFDTETTGLGGGAGNTIFLLGHARLTRDGVILTQHLLPHPGAEIALYQSFLESVNYRTLVTYNGKAFDWPQVKTRHTLVREHVPKLPSFGHFDLYHAARRMWKHRIERMKLGAVEKEVLGFERVDDIPGYLAPMIYFDFLERKHPEGLLGVLKHNELDILSLITLYTHLSFQLLGLDAGRTIRETYEVGRWFSYIGESEKAKETFQDIADGGGSDAIAAMVALAAEYKRNKEYGKALPLWKKASENGTDLQKLESLLELAKYFEHREKEYQLAESYTEKAYPLLSALNRGKAKKLEVDLEKRLIRLKRKMKHQ